MINGNRMIFDKTRLCAVFVALVLLLSAALTYARNVHDDISGEVLRLHVIANSDTATDQALKLKVRNRVLKEAEELFNTSQSRNAALSLARENITALEQAAQDEIRRNGYSYSVKAELGRYAFPTKQYGSVILPAGNYEALRIVIGSGKGQNWWCVMYPPLCFVNGTAKLPPQTEQQLKNSLSEEEYRIITSEHSGEVPVQIRFKIVELFGKLSGSEK